MCFNKEVSILIAFYSLMASIKMYMKNDLFLGTLILTLGCMQFTEFLLWSVQGNSKLEMKWNNIFTYFVIFSILFQIIGVTIVINTQYKNNGPQELYNTLWAAITIFTLIFLSLIYLSISNGGYRSTKKDLNTCRLSWDIYPKNLKNYYPYITFLLGSLYIFIITSTSILAGRTDITAIVFACLFFTIFYNYYRTGKLSTVFGSFWCLIVTVIIGVIVMFDDSS